MSTLKVTGATLHYEVIGSGPVLLLIPGGPADSAAFTGFRDVLADRNTVVTYDPRGLSDSPLDGEPEPVSVQTFADDALRLLGTFGDEPAYVLGSSGGALVGLELLAGHPERVRALVAHEPPASGLLEDTDAVSRRVHATYLSDGVGPAMAVFLAGAGLEQTAQRMAEPTPGEAEATAGMLRNLEFFLGSMFLPMMEYRPDVALLTALPAVIGVGEDSEGQLAHRTAVALAERLEQKPVFFPGDHGGFSAQPEAFAHRLYEAFSAAEHRGL
jgi:pimeloyl-ACP methyl ester carboxylesterase